jgi:hypothetical protein
MERATNISKEYVRKQVQKITKIYLHSGDEGDASGGMEIASVNIHTAQLIREAVAAVNRAEEEADKGEDLEAFLQDETEVAGEDGPDGPGMEQVLELLAQASRQVEDNLTAHTLRRFLGILA